MILEQFLQTWYAESLRLKPLQEDEAWTYEDFKNAPIVQACLSALQLNSPSYTLDFTILEENLTTCLAFKSLPIVPRTVLEAALRQVQRMKKVSL